MKQIIAVLAVLACAGCAGSTAGHVPLSVTELAAPDTTSLVESGDLRVAPLDVLEIKVFGSANLDGSYQVDPGGQLKFPLVGALDATGQTTFELATLLETKLQERFLQDPHVTVRIAEMNGQQFTVEGAIGKPGMFPVRGPLTLLQALALSGGPAQNANLDSVLIFRTIDGQRKAARFDLRKIRSGDSIDPTIYGNDLIVVDGRERNETYDEFIRGMPVLGMFMAIF